MGTPDSISSYLRIYGAELGSARCSPSSQPCINPRTQCGRL